MGSPTAAPPALSEWSGNHDAKNASAFRISYRLHTTLRALVSPMDGSTTTITSTLSIPQPTVCGIVTAKFSRNSHVIDRSTSTNATLGSRMLHRTERRGGPEPTSPLRFVLRHSNFVIDSRLRISFFEFPRPTPALATAFFGSLEYSLTSKCANTGTTFAGGIGKSGDLGTCKYSMHRCSTRLAPGPATAPP